MRKIGLSALLSGVLNMLACLITIGVFVWERIYRPSPQLTSPPLIWKVIIIIFMIYGWFAISWWLVRRHWLEYIPRLKKYNDLMLYINAELKSNQLYTASPDLAQKIALAVIPIGLLLLLLPMPMFIALLLPFNQPLFQSGTPIPDIVRHILLILLISAIILAVIGVLIFFALGFLMPIFYIDMNTDIDTENW